MVADLRISRFDPGLLNFCSLSKCIDSPKFSVTNVGGKRQNKGYGKEAY